jgi:uncharacterized membrane protein YhaH (DUF805 family)
VRFFLSFKGRFNRGKYWLFFLIYLVALVGIVVVGSSFIAAGAQGGGIGAAAVLAALLVIVFALFFIFAFVATLAVSVKRLHDRNRSGWWLLVFFFVPMLLLSIGEGANPSPDELSGAGIAFALAGFGVAIWGFVELGLLRGTVGDNRFGPDPVATPAETAAAFD